MNPASTINLQEKFQKISTHWDPKIIGELNGQHVKLAKIEGTFDFHFHEHEDELFLVVKGTMYMDFRDRTEVVQPGEIIIIPKGVEHRPRTENEEVQILMFEPTSTLNTGNIDNNKTVTELDWI